MHSVRKGAKEASPNVSIKWQGKFIVNPYKWTEVIMKEALSNHILKYFLRGKLKLRVNTYTRTSFLGPIHNLQVMSYSTRQYLSNSTCQYLSNTSQEIRKKASIVVKYEELKTADQHCCLLGKHISFITNEESMSLKKQRITTCLIFRELLLPSRSRPLINPLRTMIVFHLKICVGFNHLALLWQKVSEQTS